MANEKPSNVTKADFGKRFVGQVDIPKTEIDLQPYIGKKFKVENYEEMEGEIKGKKTHFVKLSTEPVDKIERADGKGEIILRATRLLSLSEDAEGNLGYQKDGKTHAFLKDHKVTSYKDMVGKTVIVQRTTNEKTGEKFLTFE